MAAESEEGVEPKLQKLHTTSRPELKEWNKHANARGSRGGGGHFPSLSLLQLVPAGASVLDSLGEYARAADLTGIRI